MPLFRIVMIAWAMLPLALSSSAAAQQAPLKIHILGVGEYKPVASFTEYKKHLEQQYHVAVTTSFGKDGKSLPNLEQLRAADVMVIFIRRTNLPEDQVGIIRDHWEKGKPIVALRTASHGFQEADNVTFGKVIGGDYKGPGSYTAPFKAAPAEGQKDHPVLRGIGTISSRGAYNFGKLADTAVVLQVVDSDRKVKAPASWVNTYKGGRTFYTTMGGPEDFQDEGFRRLLANAIFWTAQRDPDKARRNQDGK
jgi:type 1 glutamine amidotransferase